MKKPDGCRACPMYQGGGLFTPDRIVPGAQVMVCGQNPGELEEQGKRITEYNGPGKYVTEPTTPQPFIGPTGYALEQTYLPHTGFQRDDVSYMNALRCRWHGTNELPPKKVLAEALQHCRQYDPVIMPKLIVATGGPAMQAMTNVAEPVGDWRGYVLPYKLKGPQPTDIWTPYDDEITVLVTYHIAFVQENAWLRPVAVRDWQKVKRILSGTWPQPMPQILSCPPQRWPKKAAFDTEFAGDWLLRYSLRDESSLWVVEREDMWGSRPRVEPGTTVIMQNAEADLQFLEKILRQPVPYVNFGSPTVNVEDTMYAHAILWSDLDHDLNFGGSLYASLNRWKHLSQSNPRVYSAGDAVATLDWWNGMEGEFSRDQRSLWVYRECLLPQLWIIRDARRRGIRVNHARIGPAFQKLEQAMQAERLKAQSACGWPLNIDSSSQVAKQLYDVEGLK